MILGVKKCKKTPWLKVFGNISQGVYMVCLECKLVTTQVCLIW
jgi:hypothetical protein